MLVIYDLFISILQLHMLGMCNSHLAVDIQASIDSIVPYCCLLSSKFFIGLILYALYGFEHGAKF